MVFRLPLILNSYRHMALPSPPNSPHSPTDRSNTRIAVPGSFTDSHFQMADGWPLPTLGQQKPHVRLPICCIDPYEFLIAIHFSLDVVFIVSPKSSRSGTKRDSLTG